MAGNVKTRERLKSAEEQLVDLKTAHDERIKLIHLGLIRVGVDPTTVDTAAAAPAPVLTEYDPSLPLAIMRLAGTGMAIEEIRDSLGYTERQERAWRDQYVDFGAAAARARAREEAFWHQHMRKAAAAGDRTSVASIASLISKKFQGDAAQGDASELLHIRAKRLDQQVGEDD